MIAFRTLTLLLLLLLALAREGHFYKILVIPVGQKGHLLSLASLSEALVAKGHQVHFFLRNDFTKDEIFGSISQPIEVVQWTANFTKMQELLNVENGNHSFEKLADVILRRSLDSELSHEDLFKAGTEYIHSECRQMLMNNEEAVQTLISLRFDIAIVDGNFMTHCFFLLPHRLGIPTICYTDFVEASLVPVPWLRSFVPIQFTAFTVEMDFFQRVQNMLIEFLLPNFDSMFGESNPDIVARYRQYGHFDSTKELVKRSKLFISTRSDVIDYVKPSVANLINAGGLTTRPPRKLAQGIREFLDGAEKGAIIVTFGSMGKTLPRRITEKFLAAFARLEGYRLLWTFENTDGLTIPKWVRTERWLPQQDILAHPKTKLFVTHCGNNGQFESIYHGVPMLGFPLQGDEAYNAKRMEYKGFGISMDIHDFTSQQMYSNMMTLLTDPAFEKRASLASAIMKDSPLRPAEHAAHWVEHVLKFGSEHLEPAGKDLDYLKYHMFDIIIAAGLVLTVSLGLAFKIIVWLVRKTCGLRDGKNLKDAKKES